MLGVSDRAVRLRRWPRVALALALVAAVGFIGGCSGAPGESVPNFSSIDQEFTRYAQSFICTGGMNDILTNAEFTNSNALTAAQVQKFLNKTPYGKSCLASYTEGATSTTKGKTAAQLIVAAAKKNGINPLILIVRLQVEQGLISAKTCSKTRLNKAFGCGCADGKVCPPPQDAGFGNQLNCAAKTFSNLYNGGAAQDGWKAGKPKKSCDPNPPTCTPKKSPYTVIPANTATAVMYAYTPWVLPDAGGNYNNWFFFRRFAKPLGYKVSNLKFPEIKPPTKKGDACSGYKKPKPDAGTSKTSCIHDVDCPSGKVCAWNGKAYCCRSPGPAGTLCEADNECSGGQVCAWNGQHWYCMAPACN